MNICLVEDIVIKLTASIFDSNLYFCKPMDSSNNFIGMGRDEYSIDIRETKPYRPKKPFFYYFPMQYETSIKQNKS